VLPKSSIKIEGVVEQLLHADTTKYVAIGNKEMENSLGSGMHLITLYDPEF